MRELAREMTTLDPKEIEQALDPRRQTEPGVDRGRRSRRMSAETRAELAPPTHEEMAARLEDARARLEGVAHRTPVMTSRSLDERVAATVFLKCENLQRVGAFKFRGALQHDLAAPRRRTPPRRGGVLVRQPRPGGGARLQDARHSRDHRHAGAPPRRSRSRRPRGTAPRSCTTTTTGSSAKAWRSGCRRSGGSRSSRRSIIPTSSPGRGPPRLELFEDLGPSTCCSCRSAAAG